MRQATARPEGLSCLIGLETGGGVPILRRCARPRVGLAVVIISASARLDHF